MDILEDHGLDDEAHAENQRLVIVYVCTLVYYVCFLLKVTSKELTFLHFPCTSSEQVKLMYFLTKPD